VEDRPVFVIDLRDLEADRAALGAPAPRALPSVDEAVRDVALLVEGADPILLPIAPTDDARLLDALARLVRFAVLRQRPVAEIAARYGGDYERDLVEARRLPAWALDGVDEALPSALRILEALDRP